MPLTTDTKKVMFEIYREADFGARYKVVYFTELGEHDKETEMKRPCGASTFSTAFFCIANAIMPSRFVTTVGASEPRRSSGRELHRDSLQPYLA